MIVFRGRGTGMVAPKHKRNIFFTILDAFKFLVQNRIRMIDISTVWKGNAPESLPCLPKAYVFITFMIVAAIL